MLTAPAITRVRTNAFRFPTDAPEADGTIAWDATTMVLVEIEADGTRGIGYTYAAAAAAEIVDAVLAKVIVGQDSSAIPLLWTAMVSAVRNIGWRGVAACAISAVDVALWDLKARLLDIPLVALFGPERERVPIYGSGGFTSYSNGRLRKQLSEWVERDGCRFVKMKIGSDPARDLNRVAAARLRSRAGSLPIFILTKRHPSRSTHSDNCLRNRPLE